MESAARRDFTGESNNKPSKPQSEYGPPANFPRPMLPAAVAAAQNEEITTMPLLDGGCLVLSDQRAVKWGADT
jgi:hypothetical protein